MLGIICWFSSQKDREEGAWAARPVGFCDRPSSWPRDNGVWKSVFITREQRGQRGGKEKAGSPPLMDGEQTFLVKHGQPTSLSFFKRRRNFE